MGVPQYAAERIEGPADTQRGTSVRFKPSPEIFTHIEFHYDILAKRLRELAFLNSVACAFELRRRTRCRTSSMCSSTTAASAPSVESPGAPQERAASQRDFDLRQVGRHHRSTWRCSGPIPTRKPCSASPTTFPRSDGGTHLAGFRSRADPHHQRRTWKPAAHSRKTRWNSSGDDSREGLIAVLSVKVPDPKFSSQTKDKLVSSDSQERGRIGRRRALHSAFLDANTPVRSQEHHESRWWKLPGPAMAARKAREMTRRKSCAGHCRPAGQAG